MSHWVYALYSEKHDKLYIGESADVDDRFISHNEKATKGWTLSYRPWRIIYREECNDKPSALIREKQLKSGGGRRFCVHYLHRSSGSYPPYGGRGSSPTPATKKPQIIREFQHLVGLIGFTLFIQKRIGHHLLLFIFSDLQI
ncbi:MAG: GIY-YIG nuclease family protein [Flavobacteriales bacterium]|nr:GIY-YIG nuclease family protein [Flavobacteriales bacterium]